MYDETRTDEQNDADMERLLDGVRIGRGRPQQPTTRNDTPPNLDGDGTPNNNGNEPDPAFDLDIDVVVVEGRRPDPKPDPKPEIHFELPIPSADWGDIPGSGDSGGGGSGGSGDGDGASDDSKGYDKNPDIKYEDQTVEDLLDYLANDCMGSTLIRSLNDVTILTGQDGNHFRSSNRTIYLKCDDRYGYRDYVFLEEMIHAYQYQYYGEHVNPLRALNNEIEAKVGWLLYRDRMQNPLTPGQMRRAFDTPETQQAFIDLSNYCSQHIPSFDIELQSSYDIAVRGLQALSEYAEISYIKGDYNWSALYQLIKDC